ncbi:MAG: GDP-mannose 4,6-dehydratase [Pseudomonadota bacterium]
MKTLITGGAGFIGSHLTDFLLSQGRLVTILDDFSTGSRNNLKQIKKNRSLSVWEGSVLDKSLLDTLVRNNDETYHLAAVVGVMEYLKHPLKTLKTNIEGTENVLESTRQHGKKALIISSSEVYGYGGSDLKETDPGTIGSPVKSLRWGYGLSKSVDEFFALSYHEHFRVPLVIVRPFNIVGPRQTGFYGMVLPRFIKQAFANESITVFGNGEQTRSFTYVKTFVKILYELMDCQKANGRVINIAGKEEVSILGLAEIVKLATKSKSPITFIPYEEAYGTELFEDALKRSADVSLLESLLGWSPKETVEDIVLRTIKEE